MSNSHLPHLNLPKLPTSIHGKPDVSSSADTPVSKLLGFPSLEHSVDLIKQVGFQ